MAWSAPTTAVAGTTLTAAIWNAQVKANMEWLAQAGVTAWTAYTPTWTGSGSNPVIGNGTLAGVYSLSAKRVQARFLCLAGSTTTFGTGSYAFDLPVTTTTVGSNRPIGMGVVDDFGTALKGTWAIAGTTTICWPYHTDTTLTRVGATTPHTMVSGDSIHMWLAYEAA